MSSLTASFYKPHFDGGAAMQGVWATPGLQTAQGLESRSQDNSQIGHRGRCGIQFPDSIVLDNDATSLARAFGTVD